MVTKGQVQMVGVMLGFMVFLTGMVLINAFKDEVTRARAVDGLDCANSSISDFEAMSCIVVGATFPVWLGVVFAVAFGLIGLSQIKFRGES